MSIGIGLAVNNTRASSRRSSRGEFARTPKYTSRRRPTSGSARNAQNFVVRPVIELVLGHHFTATVFYALARHLRHRALPHTLPDRLPLPGLLSIMQQYATESVPLSTVAEEES
jgi:hypothetical protein